MKKILLICVTGILMISSAMTQPERIEPPFWWAGMKHPALQLMVYGKDMAQCRVTIDAPKTVTLKKVSKLTSPDYLFIDLRIAVGAQPGFFNLNFMLPGGETYTRRYELKQREPGSAEREGFNASDVIYLIMPDRWANGDPDNDEIPGMPDTLNRKDPYGRHGGDLQGILDHLDYIREMGFTQLWLNPVLENNQDHGSYHGYAVTDFYKVDPRLGSNELYRKLSEEAAKRGIGMIMDMIFNHCGSNHWWMKNPPSQDWINHYPDFVPTNHRRTVNEDPHASEFDRKGMTNGWFVPTMPDLNQKNPFLATYLIQNSIWWIEYAHLTGIRMDTYPYPDKWMMAEWNRRVLKEYPRFNIVGEEWSLQPGIVSYWQRGQKNHDHYDGMLPSLMDFPLHDALVKALTQPEGWNTGWINLYETLALDFLYPDPQNLVIFPDNHDMPRFFMQLNQDRDLFRLGMVYILTTRGIPQIFYGTENLMTHTEGNGHGVIRKDFPGGWPGDRMNAFTGKNMAPRDREMQMFVKKLLNWRKNEPIMHFGKLVHFAPFDGIYTYFRIGPGGKYMIVLNKNRESYNLDTERFLEILDGAQSGLDIISGVKYGLDHPVSVPPRTALILKIKE